MTSKTETPDPFEPFYVDERTIQEKLAATEREYRPHQPAHGCPAIIGGLVLETGEYFSEYGDGEPVPTLRLLDRSNTVWSIIGFHGRLRYEIEKTKPRIGDYVAIAHRGVIPAKKKGMNDAHDYALAVERNPDAVDVETDDSSDELPVYVSPEPDEEPEKGGDVDGDGIPF